MQEELRSILGENVTTNLEVIVDLLSKLDLTSEEIAEEIFSKHEIYRVSMHVIALTSGKKDLADKIKEANRIINKKRVISFKASVLDGTYEEFLSNMHWTDKSSLMIDMKFLDIIPLTPENKNYYDIIESSIENDIEKEALSKGFDSVNAWKEHNAKMLIE